MSVLLAIWMISWSIPMAWMNTDFTSVKYCATLEMPDSMPIQRNAYSTQIPSSTWDSYCPPKEFEWTLLKWSPYNHGWNPEMFVMYNPFWDLLISTDDSSMSTPKWHYHWWHSAVKPQHGDSVTQRRRPSDIWKMHSPQPLYSATGPLTYLWQ